MTRTKIASALLLIGLTACAKDEGDEGTTAATVTVSTTNSSADSSGGEEGTSAGTSASTTMTSADTSAEGPADSSGGGGCTADDECITAADCAAGEECLAAPACTCFASADSSGGGCPEGETCQMTGQMTMACLADPDHCVLVCGAMTSCPDTMVCQGGVCHYDVSMAMTNTSDPNYPQPEGGVCPEGFDGPYFFDTMEFLVCTPLCDAGMCPDGATGNAQAGCLFNPDSSALPC
jgi:hypothetical protein